MSNLVYWSAAAAASSVVLWFSTRKLFDRVSKIIAEVNEISADYLRSMGSLDVQDRAPRGFLIDAFMPPDRAEDVNCNLLRRYDYWVEKHGARRARIIFFLQSAGSILTFWTDWLMKRLKLLKTFVSS